jgi:hypothetical protein
MLSDFLPVLWLTSALLVLFASLANGQKYAKRVVLAALGLFESKKEKEETSGNKQDHK